MTGYYLSEEERKEAYNNRFYSWNLWFERNLGRIVGEGFSVRNWFGPCEEGDWTELYEQKDWFATMIITLFSFMVVGLWITANTNNFALAIITTSFPLGIYSIYIANLTNKKFLLEFINVKISTKYLKTPIFIVLFWIIINLLLNSITLQQIIMPTTGMTIINTFMIYYIPIINMPVIETLAFGGVFVASLAVWFGIVPSLSFSSFLVGIIHYTTFGGSFISIVMSMFLWFMLLGILLKYKDAFPAVFGHSLANTLTIILNGLLK